MAQATQQSGTRDVKKAASEAFDRMFRFLRAATVLGILFFVMAWIAPELQEKWKSDAASTAPVKVIMGPPMRDG